MVLITHYVHSYYYLLASYIFVLFAASVFFHSVDYLNYKSCGNVHRIVHIMGFSATLDLLLSWYKVS